MQDTQILQLLDTYDSTLEWFKENIGLLKEKYNNNFVAIENREVIAYDPKMEGLINKLKHLNKDASKIFIQFVSKIKTIF